ncbi:MAG: lipoyl(octanoyl) transferase LipB [Thermoplasmata archaeon]|uniref:Probable octanoyltransferase n=1 Tax=Candidatus Sysuiplasma superficiale TaxID=2823368 RepID=A0A8J7YSP9_9ARCH|nr:lipoyl(octanoyl) transferase LipB [Candidatus Sysuiplasma superficiale]
MADGVRNGGVKAGGSDGRRCNILRLGTTDYGECLSLQRKLLLLRQTSSIYDSLLLTQHHPVVTFGRNYTGELPDLPVPVFSIERGGEGTYHCPGQFVAYPIINLADNGLGVRTLVKKLQAVAVASLRSFGIESEGRLEPVGIWTGNMKIGSIGIAVKRWVTFHGIAININNDLDGFNMIKPCGLDSSVMTSAARILGHTISFGEFEESFISNFMREFGFTPTERSSAELLRQ